MDLAMVIRYVPKDDKRAYSLIQKAHQLGHGRATTYIGMSMHYGLWGRPLDCRKAMEYYQQAFHKGNSESGWLLGACYYYGEGVKKDLRTAAELFQQSAALGCGAALFALGKAFSCIVIITY